MDDDPGSPAGGDSPKDSEGLYSYYDWSSTDPHTVIVQAVAHTTDGLYHLDRFAGQLYRSIELRFQKDG